MTDRKIKRIICSSDEQQCRECEYKGENKVNCPCTTVEYEAPQQPISIEAIEKMAEKEADELVFNEHGDLFSNNNNEAANAFLVTKKGYLKGFTSALGYSAGDKK